MMRLTSNWLDQLDREQRYQPEYVLMQDQAFEGVRVVIDNHQFARCSFRRCVLTFSGGPFGLSECDFDNETELVLTGAAMRGVALLRELSKRPSASPKTLA
jgi:hypothetical protein